MRPSKRQPDELRRVSIERAVSKHAEGSCLIKFGDTQVLCTASLEERVPPWLKGQGRGWVTAEYGMLPRATTERTRREVTVGHASGRTQEIQRLIGRALRAIVDLTKLGERQISIDCDVLQADGGTRTASITGAWVALHDCIQWMKLRDMVKDGVLRDQVAAVCCGLYKGAAVLDLDYAEDSAAEANSNFVMTGTGGIVEVQGTAETVAFSQESFDRADGARQEGHRRAGGSAEAHGRLGRCMLAGHLALTVAAMFTGAAFYVGFAEQPARLQLDDRAQLAQWKPSYKRGFAMQGTLAVAGFLLGALQWWQSGDGLWLLGALLLVANWPFTLFVIMPTNKVLMATPTDAAGAGSRLLVVKWGRLHAVRTALGAAATLVFLWAAT